MGSLRCGMNEAQMTDLITLSRYAETILEADRRFEQEFAAWISAVGPALIEARDLLASQGKTGSAFQTWLAEEVKMSRRRAYQLMDAYERFHTLCTTVHKVPLPANEGQCRELVSLPDGDVVEVWGKVVERAEQDELPITAKLIRQCAAPYRQAAAEHPTLVPPEGHFSSVGELANTGLKFATVYADPPWRYENQATRASTDNHYQTMTVEQICDEPVEQIAADNAHLHLWTTNAFLFEAQRVIEAWGFTYKSCFVWCKPQMGIGNYWRVSHEFLLLGVRGSCPFINHDQASWLQHDRTQHSAKPAIVRKTLEAVSPPPRVELYARTEHHGWTAVGNQIETTIFH